MSKDRLRNKLFDKYFEVESGIPLALLNERLSLVRNVWCSLRKLCEESIEHFDYFSSLDAIKMVDLKGSNYLILKLNIWKYVIIDTINNKNISDDVFKNCFDEKFFIDNFAEFSFEELELDDNTDITNVCNLISYNGDVRTLINFYKENKDVLDLPNFFKYQLGDKNAFTYLFIDFAGYNSQIGFQTPNQFLYEHLFLNPDLTPSTMQDAQECIGVVMMKKMFDKIPFINIPETALPKELYQYYLKQVNTVNANSYQKRINKN